MHSMQLRYDTIRCDTRVAVLQKSAVLHWRVPFHEVRMLFFLSLLSSALSLSPHSSSLTASFA